MPFIPHLATYKFDNNNCYKKPCHHITADQDEFLSVFDKLTKIMEGKYFHVTLTFGLLAMAMYACNRSHYVNQAEHLVLNGRDT